MIGINWLQAKIVGIILLFAFFIIFILLIRDDIKVRYQYDQANKNLIAIANQQAFEQKLAIEVKERQDENFKTQNKALLEMHQKGYLADPHGDNPDWMCASPGGCDKAKSPSESSK